MTPREALPIEWLGFLGTGKIGIGSDLGTTAKATSNPSCIVVTQHQPDKSLYYERLVFRFKTAEYQIALAVHRMIVEDILTTGRRPKSLCIDASNNEFFAQMIRKDLAGKCPVNLVKGGENVVYRGVKGLAKPVIGNLYTSAYEDNFMAIPQEEWILKDRRLVKREKGSFQADLDENGAHADSFDGGKLGLWALEGGGGNVEAMAMGPSPFGWMDEDEKALRPFHELFEPEQVSVYA